MNAKSAWRFDERMMKRGNGLMESLQGLHAILAQEEYKGGMTGAVSRGEEP